MASPDFGSMLAEAHFVPATALMPQEAGQQKPAEQTTPSPQSPQQKPDTTQDQQDDPAHPTLRTRPPQEPKTPVLDQIPGNTVPLGELARQSAENERKEHEKERDDAKKKLTDYVDAKEIHPPAGEDAKKLNDIMDKLAAAAPGSVPEAKNAAPRPDIYVYDGDYNAVSFTSDSKKTTAIAISSKMLHDLPPDQLEAVMAHEYGHLMVAQNPEMLQNYHPRDSYGTQRELEKLSTYETKAKMSEDDKASGRSNYLNEALADDIAVRLTKNPQAFEAVMKNFAPIANKENKQSVHDAIQDEIKLQEKNSGHTLSPKEKKQIEREVILESKTSDPHPSAKMREGEAKIEGEQLGITKETFIERIDRKIEELMHLHGGNTAEPSTAAPHKPDQNIEPKALPTPNTPRDIVGGLHY